MYDQIFLCVYFDRYLENCRDVVSKILTRKCFNPIQYGHFWGCSRIGGSKKGPLPKISHTYPTMMVLGTVIPYLKKIQKIYESRDTHPEFC